MEPELRAALEALRDQVAQVDQRAEGLRRQVETTAVETRRHFDVVAERVDTRLQLVAEGVTALADRVDRVEASIREDLREVQRELSAMIRFSYAEIEAGR